MEMRLKPTLRIESPEVTYSYSVDTPENELNKLSSEIQIIDIKTFDYLKERNDVTLPAHVEEGDILILHPFLEKHYVKIIDAEIVAYNDYLNYIGNIAMLLGAVKMKYSFEIINTQKRTIDANGNISYQPYVDASASFNHNNEQNKAISKKTERSFVQPNSHEEQMENYQEACKTIRQYGWDKDSDIITLVDARNPSRTSRELHREVSMNTTNEINDRIEAAFSLKAMGEIFSISANYIKSMEIKKEIILHIDIFFENE